MILIYLILRIKCVKFYVSFVVGEKRFVIEEDLMLVHSLLKISSYAIVLYVYFWWCYSFSSLIY